MYFYYMKDTNITIYSYIYTLSSGLWQGYKSRIATVVYLLPYLSGAKKHNYVKQLIQYSVTL